MLALVGGPAALLLAMWKLTTVPRPYASGEHSAAMPREMEAGPKYEVPSFIFSPPLVQAARNIPLYIFQAAWLKLLACNFRSDRAHGNGPNVSRARAGDAPAIERLRPRASPWFPA